jgi:GT2 family glycosyltransferase
VNTDFQPCLTSDRIYGRNILAKRAIDQGAEWLLFIDDDHVFPDDLLLRLLAHELPIVGALYVQRQPPFRPLAYSARLENRYEFLDLTKHGPNDLVEVAALGTGGMLIRSEVLHEMPFPWFEHGVASEDLIFCDKARALGFPVHVDLGCRMGHMLPSAVWPGTSSNGEWHIGFALAEEFAVKVPIDNSPTDLYEPTFDSESRVA